MNTNFIYQDVLKHVQHHGALIHSRNATTKSCIDLLPISFTETPLITVRKTAWKLALREMEWFLSGEENCPDELLHWWSEQLNPLNSYTRGYSAQLRHFGCYQSHVDFDQIQYVLDGIQTNPNSRRLILTTWNAYDMAHITEFNNNKNTPTCCHTTIVQFFVREHSLFMTSYQRSADLLLGVPHNWIQSWALLLWFAYHTNLSVGHLRWVFGDAHIYQVQSHLDVVDQIIQLPITAEVTQPVVLKYYPQGNPAVFKASDFVIEGTIDKPQVFGKPELL